MIPPLAMLLSVSMIEIEAYSIGLPAFIIMKVLLTGFFSRQDTKTPVKYGIYAIIFNVTIESDSGKLMI